MAQSTKKVDGGRIGGPAVIGNCIEVRIHWALANGRAAQSVLHGRNLGGFTPSVAIATTIGNALISAWTTNLAAFCPTSVVHGVTSVRDMGASTNVEFVGTSTQAAGTSASPGMPSQTALVLSGKGIQRGKGMSARYYVPGWATNADSGGGVASPALVTALTPYMTAIFSAFTANGLQPCVAHPHRQTYTGLTGTVHADRPAGTVDIQSWTLKDNIFDTQRARVKP